MAKLHLSGDVVIVQCLCLARDHFLKCSIPHYIYFGVIKNRLFKNDLQISIQLREGSCNQTKKVDKNKSCEHNVPFHF